MTSKISDAASGKRPTEVSSSTSSEVWVGWMTLQQAGVEFQPQEPSTNFATVDKSSSSEDWPIESWRQVLGRVTAAGSHMSTQIKVNNFQHKIEAPLTFSTKHVEFSFAVAMSPPTSSNAVERGRLSQEVMKRILQMTSRLYRDLLTKCEEIIRTVDVEDLQTASVAVDRLKDILGPFNSVIEAAFRGVLENQQTQPLAVSFLLNELLPSIDGMTLQSRLSIIQSVLQDRAAPIRFTAVQALDNLGVARAKELLAHAYPTETSHIIKSLIESSLKPS